MNNSLCLLCYTNCKRIYNIKNTYLQTVFENVTNLKVQSQCSLLCFICYTKLQQCGQLWNLAQRKHGFLKNFQEDKVKQFESQKSLANLSLSNINSLSVSSKCVKVSSRENVKVESFQTDDDVTNEIGIKNETFHFQKIKEENYVNTSIKPEDSYEQKSVLFKNNLDALEERKIKEELINCEDAESMDVESNSKYRCKIEKEDKETSNIGSDTDFDVPFINLNVEKEFDTSDNSKNDVQNLTDSNSEEVADNSEINHKIIGSVRYTCDICPYETKLERTLNNHLILLHGNIKGANFFSCKYCAYVNKKKSNVLLHEMIHTGEKPFSCNICKSKFTRKSALKVHKKIHKGKKRFSCEVCPSTFYHMFDLERHMLIHTGDKPYVCDICDRGFNRLSNMEVHKRTHKEDKLFSCEICNKHFTRSNDLKRHKATHDKIKRYVCKICGRKYTRGYNLRNHEKSHEEG